MSGRWRRYFDAAGMEPRPTLLAALAAWGDRPPGRAVDLGCGTGRDTLALLARGWSVTAIDGEAEALARLDAAVTPAERGRLTLTRARFEAMDAVPPAELINASMSLPFCPRAAFPAFWRRIRTALAPGGVFAGHLLGPNDGWAARGVVVLDRAAVAALLEGWMVLRCDENDYDGVTAVGARKHWHLFEIVARRPH